MLLFFVTAGAEALSLIMERWIPVVYRVYYLFAAIQVSVMGAGLIYLFTSRNIINERNSAKSLLLFGSIWLLLSSIFAQWKDIFTAVQIPALIMVLSSIVYILFNFLDKRRFQDVEQISVCSWCRRDNESAPSKCQYCDNAKFVLTHPSSTYPRVFQRIFRGHNFAHFFLMFALYLFLLMNLYVWDTWLNTDYIESEGGQEISGTGWMEDPNKNDWSIRPEIRLFSPLHTAAGGMALIGGGVYSYVTWQLAIRKQTGKFDYSQGFFNIYIAFGAFVLGQGGLISGYGIPTLYIAEVISVAFMYYGFLESDKLTKDKLLKALNISWIWKRGSDKKSKVNNSLD
jgi:hypothetical protein